MFHDSHGKRKIESGVERRNCAGCGDLSSVDRNGNDVWGAPAERFQRHEELKESVRVIGGIDGVRRILLDKGHVVVYVKWPIDIRLSSQPPFWCGTLSNRKRLEVRFVTARS